MLGRLDWAGEVSACVAPRWPSYGQGRQVGLAFEEGCLAVAVEGTQADLVVVDSLEEVAGTGRAAVGLAGRHHAVAVVAVGCEAVAGRRHLLER